ncbi:MAG: type II secretion system minor pseudopilin GspK [Desulfobulbaceae bacterium]|nr:type II secretion system minor pseudopilin GspK [Desulfobulbaceae bacterium]
MKLLPDNQGMALLLVLFVVGILISVTVEIGSTVNWQLYSSHNQADTVRLDAMLSSGLNISFALLTKDEQATVTDSLLDPWAIYDSDALSSFFDGEGITIQINDLTGKLQVNSLIPANKSESEKSRVILQRKLWLRFLTSGHFAVEGEEEAESLLDALSDWIDKDDEERPMGAESNYYQSLEQGHECANAPFIRPEELLAVKGMTKELLYGTKEHEGLINYIDVYGQDGKININTANPLILSILAPGIPEDGVEALVEYRTDESNKDALNNISWYKNTSFPSDITISPQLLTVNGDYYQVNVKAEYKNLRRQGVGTIHRLTSGQQNLLSWKVE